eukprot:scaffold258383_cov28-Tisochrysis_lutea.AAC.2
MQAMRRRPTLAVHARFRSTTLSPLARARSRRHVCMYRPRTRRAQNRRCRCQCRSRRQQGRPWMSMHRPCR